MRAPDHAKNIALQALSADPTAPGSLLESIARYCLRELGYLRTGEQLVALLDELRTEIEEA